jgi:hypothetical protein
MTNSTKTLGRKYGVFEFSRSPDEIIKEKIRKKTRYNSISLKKTN